VTFASEVGIVANPAGDAGMLTAAYDPMDVRLTAN
jgi:hypothetical protein